MKKIALVGCGRISKRHIEAILKNKNLKLEKVCDIIPEKAKAIAKNYGISYETNYKKIKGVDVIAVLTPSGLHPKHAAEIAEYTDAKFIVCEKPISLTLREAFELYNAIEKKGKILLPVYQNRYNPLIKHIKKLIDNKVLGKIYLFITNILWNRNDDYFKIDWHGTQELDGGILYTQASHYVDMLHYFFGEVQDYKGIGGTLRNLEVLDTISATMKFKNGIVGSLNATINVYKENYQTEFTLITEKGTIRLSGTNLNKIDYWQVEDIKKPNLEFDINHIYGKGHDVLYKYIAEDKWDEFPSKQDVISGIKLMEQLSF